jgi:hypothetical protein
MPVFEKSIHQQLEGKRNTNATTFIVVVEVVK